ncbi:MAG: hypothetical protein H0U77_10865 [Nocardioidaceae bacterium]|nr:hypothetical protein [Nocardioidaceae bacterium]
MYDEHPRRLVVALRDSTGQRDCARGTAQILGGAEVIPVGAAIRGPSRAVGEVGCRGDRTVATAIVRTVPGIPESGADIGHPRLHLVG